MSSLDMTLEDIILYLKDEMSIDDMDVESMTMVFKS